MEREITDSDRGAMVRSAVARLRPEDLKTALAHTSDATFAAPNAVTNALNALRRHRQPAGVVTRPQYRAALPYVAAAAADACLAKTIEALGDHSDDPTRDQLLSALEAVREGFPDAVIGAMLASVADADMPASDLCFEVAATDDRFGLTDWAEGGGEPDGESTAPVHRRDRVTTPEQREARRLKKQRDAEERRKKLDSGPTGRGAGTPGPETGAVWRRSGGRVRGSAQPQQPDRSGVPAQPAGRAHALAGARVRP